MGEDAAILGVLLGRHDNPRVGAPAGTRVNAHDHGRNIVGIARSVFVSSGLPRGWRPLLCCSALQWRCARDGNAVLATGALVWTAGPVGTFDFVLVPCPRCHLPW